MEELLVGTKLETAAIKRIAALVGESFNPLTDFRGSSDYRLKGAQGLLKRMQLEIISPETPTEIWSL
jgi:xanthine dehydrogenase small subunit